MIRRLLPELAAVGLLLLLPLLLFAPVALGPRTLLPADILYMNEPYRAMASDVGVDHPQNHLVADLILENYAWKQLIVEAMRDRQLPLWDPYIFAGHPFLANGQHSALYPLSVLFYVLPLWRAFGVFIWLQLGLAGVFAYVYLRVLGVRRLGGLIAGITFQFSGMMIASAGAHPMIVAGASWLPIVLAMVELTVQRRPVWGSTPTRLPWVVLGAACLGCQMLAGHVENTYFVLLVTGAYALWRLVFQALRAGGRKAAIRESGGLIAWLALMVGLGLALGAVQFVPLYEVVQGSFRSGETAASLEQVLGWAYPPRRLITFGVPNFFGNPSHHGYFDLFTWRWTPALQFADGRYVDWGIKNYVEGGAYLGLLPLFLAGIAVVTGRVAGPGSGSGGRRVLDRFAGWLRHPYIPFFTLLACFSLACVFGTPVYALVYALPGLEQSHSPFRWVFPLTVAVAVLAGFGVEAVARSRNRLAAEEPGGRGRQRPATSRLFFLGASPSLVTFLAGLAFWGGVVTLAGLVLSRVLFVPIEPWVEQVFLGLARAPEAFSDHRAFYSYEFKWVGLFGLLLAGTGIVLRVSRCPIYLRRRPVWEFLLLGLLLVDFFSFGAGFNPAVDPALLDVVPPVVQFLKQDTGLWRYAPFTPPGTTKTMNRNVGMFYNLQSIDGYDSLFTAEYRDYMSLIEPQDETQYNRIAPLREWSSLDSPLVDLLNVKYVVTEVEIPNPKYELVYRDQAVRVYQNMAVIPRAYSLPVGATLATADFGTTVQTTDPRQYVILHAGDPVWETPVLDAAGAGPGQAISQAVTGYSINEVTVDVDVSCPSWLVVADAYFPGWKAFIRPQGAGTGEEREVDIYRVNGVFRGMLVEPGAWSVRFKYSPNSVKIGAFVSFIGGMAVLFLVGLYLWRFFYREEEDNTVRRVAKNSIAPITLNLFNRLIDMAFAALMARVLGPVGTGRYFTATLIYTWFDIVANFGLEMYLMREVARDRARTRLVFVNATVLRLLLYVAVIPLLAGFLAGRQALGQPLAGETVWAVGLLFAGFLPISVANGLTGLFRGFEKHEYPAAVETVTTIVKVTLQVLALAGGLGIMGVAGATILTNLTTMIILAVLARRLIWPHLPPGPEGVQRSLMGKMVADSWPLMASLLLQALFPGVNGVMLQFWQGDRVAGWYDAGRKWVDNLNLVPSIFTFAVFPLMSRQAAQDRSGLRRSYRLSVKLLLMLALPVAVVITLLATPLVGLLSGQQYLPHGAVVLRLLIWSILFGWVNSLTNYVLIALDRQRFVLVASGARVLFAIVANLIFVRSLGYLASAWVIVAGELLLVVLFYADLRRHLGAVRWAQLLWRPALAALAMGAVVWGLVSFSPGLALVSGTIVYPVALILVQAFTAEEQALLAPLLPDSVRRFLGVGKGRGGSREQGAGGS